MELQTSVTLFCESQKAKLSRMVTLFFAYYKVSGGRNHPLKNYIVHHKSYHITIDDLEYSKDTVTVF